MRLVHFSAEPLGPIHSMVQVDFPHHDVRKPQGLWVSDEDDYGWSQWCESSEFGIGQLQHLVTLKSDAKILHIDGPAQLESFTDEFGEFLLPGVTDLRYVDWQAVADRYDGILITPYLWSCRLEDAFFWYYVWDCASGCIWNADAIASVTLIEGTTDA